MLWIMESGSGMPAVSAWGGRSRRPATASSYTSTLPESPSAARNRPSTRPTHIWTVNSVRRTVAKLMTSSCVGPAADQIVIKPRQRHDLLAVADATAQALDGIVEFEQHGARGFVADHTLNPEEGGPAAAAGHRRDVMAAGGGIDDQIARRQLDFVTAERVFDHQFATVIIIRIGQEQGRRQVSAHADRLAGALHETDGVI